MEIYLTTLDRKEIFKFPIVESKNVAFGTGAISEKFENSAGREIILVGKEKLRTVSIKSFFPHKVYRWLPFNSATSRECIDFITKHIADTLKLTIIGDSFSWIFPVVITDFSFNQKENRDIAFSISFEEQSKEVSK